MPVALLCEKIHGVVVGGGNVGTRKALTLLDSGALVTVISITHTDELIIRAESNERLVLKQRAYAGIDDLSTADLVIAATESVETNRVIARDAQSLHRIVSLVNAPMEGSFTSMAFHRSDNLTVGVTAGQAPKEAMRVRDAIAQRFAELTEVRS